MLSDNSSTRLSDFPNVVAGFTFSLSVGGCSVLPGHAIGDDGMVKRPFPLLLRGMVELLVKTNELELATDNVISGLELPNPESFTISLADRTTLAAYSEDQ